MDGLSVIKRAANAIPRWPFTINRQSEQARQLVGWYPMAPFYGSSLADMTGNCNPGSLTSDMRWSTSEQIGPAIETGASSSTVATISDSAINTIGGSNSKFSLSLWYYWITEPAGYQWLVFKGQGNGASVNAVEIRLFGSDIQIIVVGGGIAISYSVPSARKVGAWNHIVLTVARELAVIDEGILFFNGISVGSFLGYGNSTSSGDPYLLGMRADGYQGSFQGRLADFRIYNNRVLSASEVWALYDPATRYELYQPVHSRLYFAPIAGANTRVSDFNIAIGAV